ncbi:MAG: hypothetical protein ACRCU5_01725 [Rhizobiaceae bacterium]
MSTPETPFCLRNINNRPSMLVRTLQALEADPAFGSPIVVLSDSAARLGVSEVTRIRPDAKIILVPAAVGSGISSLLAGLEVLETCRSEHMALVPGSFFATDPSEAFRSLAAIATQPLQLNQVALMTRRSHRPGCGLRMELGERLQNSPMFRLSKLHPDISTEIAALLEEAKALVVASGPSIVRTRNLVKHVQLNDPTAYVACHNAMKLAQKYGLTLRPQGDFLSLAGRPSVRDYFQSALPDLYAFIGNPDWRTIETFRDPLFDAYNSAPITPVGIAGPSDHKVIASQDGILILQPGHEDAVKAHYPDPKYLGISEHDTRQAVTSLRFIASR